MSRKQAAYVLGILTLAIMLVILLSVLTSQTSDNPSQPDTAAAPNRVDNPPAEGTLSRAAPIAAPLISTRAGSIPNKPKH